MAIKIRLKNYFLLFLTSLFFLPPYSYAMNEDHDTAAYTPSKLDVTEEIDLIESYTRFYHFLEASDRERLCAPSSATSELDEVFSAIEDALFLKRLYLKSLVLESSSEVSYASLRKLFPKNSRFKTVEEEAKEKILREYCLSEHDQEPEGWLSTYFYYSLFFQGSEDAAVRKTLARKGFPLLHSDEFSSPEVSVFTTEKTAKVILKEIDKIQHDMIKAVSIHGSVAPVLSLIKCLESVTLNSHLLSMLGVKITSLPDLLDWCVTENGQGTLESILAAQMPTYEWSQFLRIISEALLSPRIRDTICQSLLKIECLKKRDVSNEEMNESLFTEESLVIMELHRYILEELINPCQRKIVDLYNQLLEQGNTMFILVWQRDMSLSFGLDMDVQRDLYARAQKTYLSRFGEVYSGYFPLDSTIREFVGVSHRREDSKVEDFLKDPRDNLVERMTKVEEEWRPLVDLGDPFVPYILARTWAYSSLDYARERFKYWKLRYEALGSTLPFGDLDSL
ncbi:MAG: hypothetical protein JSR85_02075 [Proteobacteria bacterium]|nr:hypothetical protein [Pseudomonadota bacterium]